MREDDLDGKDLRWLELGGPEDDGPPRGLRLFLDVLRPPRPGLGRTLLVAILLTLAGVAAPAILIYGQHEREDPRLCLRWGNLGVIETVEVRMAWPHRCVASAAGALYWGGCGCLAVPLTLGAGFFLLRGRGRSRVGLPLFLLATGAVGAVWAISGPFEGAGWHGLGSPVSPVLAVAGAAVSAWLLLRPAIGPTREATFSEALPSLMLVAALVMNLALVAAFPDYTLALVLGTETALSSPKTADLIRLLEAAPWTTAVLGLPLVLVPALVVAEGCGVRGALLLLGRLLRRRPAVVILSYLCLGVLTAIEVIVCVVLFGIIQSCLFGRGTDLTAHGVLSGATVGTALGLFVYTAALFARALAAASRQLSHEGAP